MATFRRDLEAIVAIVADAGTDLFGPVPSSSEHTVLREVLIVADHNADHAGELGILRQVGNAWGRTRAHYRRHTLAEPAAPRRSGPPRRTGCPARDGADRLLADADLGRQPARRPALSAHRPRSVIRRGAAAGHRGDGPTAGQVAARRRRPKTTTNR